MVGKSTSMKVAAYFHLRRTWKTSFPLSLYDHTAERLDRSLWQPLGLKVKVSLGGPVTFLPVLNGWTGLYANTHIRTPSRWVVFLLLLWSTVGCHRQQIVCHTVCAEPGSQTLGRNSGSRSDQGASSDAWSRRDTALPLCEIRAALLRFKPGMTGEKRRHMHTHKRAEVYWISF